MLDEEVEMSTYSSSVESNGQAGPMGRSGLKGSTGLWMATALVVGNMIGSGIILLPAAMSCPIERDALPD